MKSQVGLLNLTISRSLTRFVSVVSMEWWDRAGFYVRINIK